MHIHIVYTIVTDSAKMPVPPAGLSQPGRKKVIRPASYGNNICIYIYIYIHISTYIYIYICSIRGTITHMYKKGVI